MLRNLIRPFLILGLFFLLSACAGGPKYKTWQEEVKLNDGRIIIVAQKRLCHGGYTGGNVASCIEREGWLTVKLPEFGTADITWHEHLVPTILNLHKGQLYLVGTPATWVEFNLYGKPRPPYIGFIFENGQWRRIPFEDIPEAIYDTNLVIDGSQVKTDFLTLLKKSGSSFNGAVTYPKQAKRIDPAYKSNW